MGKRPLDRSPVRVSIGTGRHQEVVVISFQLEGDWRSRLTEAERAVADLLIEGYADAEIARCRRTSPRTVANQVASILRKVGVGSRVELAARVASGEGERG